MGQRPRQKPEHLAAKLLQIRESLGLSQTQMATRLDLKVHYAGISEYENGVREPNLMLLLRYARLAGVCTCVLIDDEIDLDAQPHKKSRTRSKANAHH